jgi:hypothetical protein
VPLLAVPDANLGLIMVKNHMHLAVQFHQFWQCIGWEKKLSMLLIRFDVISVALSILCGQIELGKIN